MTRAARTKKAPAKEAAAKEPGKGAAADAAETAVEKAAAREIAWLYLLQCEIETGKRTLGDALLAAYLRGREGRG